MKISYDEAFYYKLLLQSGFNKEIDEFVNYIINNNEILDGINLDFVIAYNLKENSLNEMISCLHNYINNNKIDNRYVCDKLRMLIKNKVDNNEITLEDAGSILSEFAYISEKKFEEYFNDLYDISIYMDYIDIGFINKEKYFKIVKDYLDTGVLYKTNSFWKNRNKKSKKNGFIKSFINRFHKNNK